MAIGITLARIIHCDFVFHWLCRCVATVTIASICALSNLNVMSCLWWLGFKLVAQAPKTPLSTLFILLLVFRGVLKYIFENPKTIDWKHVLYEYLVLLLCVLLSLHWLLHCIKAVYSWSKRWGTNGNNLLNVWFCWTGRMKQCSKKTHWAVELHRLVLNTRTGHIIGSVCSVYGTRNCPSVERLEFVGDLCVFVDSLYLYLSLSLFAICRRVRPIMWLVRSIPRSFMLYLSPMCT